MIEVLWEFKVASGREAEFEGIYNSDGEWAKLFRSDGRYDGTTLLRDSADGRRYVTIDRWQSRESYEGFKARHEKEYKALDARCEALTEQEHLLGIYERV
jgi:heme-degrading monooxygenase HmoA